MEKKDKVYILLIIFLMSILVFLSGYTLGEERMEDKLKKQITDMGICHIGKTPYRCEKITRLFKMYSEDVKK